ncbi:PCI domain-containing protein [Gautieria morchelliformis]|nr:PCI domain-containing protein [Gautieria morchelliformis]
MSKSAPKDVEMKEVEPNSDDKTNSSNAKPLPPSAVEEIKSNITLIERAVSTLEPRFTHRVLRSLTHLRRRLDNNVLRETIAEVYTKDSPAKRTLLSWISTTSSLLPTDTASMDVDLAGSRSGLTPTSIPKLQAQAEPLPESEIYLRLLIIYHLLDNASGLPRYRAGDPKSRKAADNARELYVKSVSLAHETVERMQSFNRRSLDPMAAKVWSATGRAYELGGDLSELRPLLLNAQRTASLRHDTETLATLVNLLLRSYLLTSSYTAASTFLSKITYPDSSVSSATATSGTTPSTNTTSSNGAPSSLNQLLSGSTSSPAQLARYLYYVGRIRAIELSYTLAHNHLLQAVRRAPKAEQAPGFWQEVHKWLVVVELLMGDIPERSTFRQPVLRKALEGYFEIVKAVRTGSLSQFQATLSTYSATFAADKTCTLILRLRQNVIKTGIRRLSLSYSRISLRDICVKLHLDSEEDAEYIVGKAIRDGVIEGRIVHERGWMECGSGNKGAYGAEVSEAFNRRIGFCLGLHNESVKAMRYPLNAHRKELAAAEGAREREKELAKEIQDGDLDEDEDPLGGSEF